MSAPIRKDHSTLNTTRKDNSSISFQPKKEELDLLAPDDNDITLLDALSTTDAVAQLPKEEIKEIIRGAHHELLYTSGNGAYIKVWNELHRVK
jgi:hypothetical protein